MSNTTRIPKEQLEQYFDTFTKRFLRDGSPEAADVELVSMELGDQPETQGARLIGITYDQDTHMLEFEFDSGDHRVYEPREVWVVEEADGFLSAIQVVRPDGASDIATVKHVGLRRLE